MTDSADGESSSRPDADQPTRTPTQGPVFSPGGDESPAHPATAAAQPRPAEDAGWEHTATATGGPWPGGAAGQGQVRYSRGVPGAAPAGQADVSAGEVWRTGRLPARPPRRGRWRWAGTALTAVLLIACGVVVYLRLHHAPLAVTGVAITSQVKNGCAVDVTGRISTNGGSGTVSYQWVFTPQVTAPQPLSQSVTGGQSAVYVTVSDQGTGHGQTAQQVVLQVLGPGQGSAATHVNISC